MTIESSLQTPRDALPSRWKILLYGYPGSGKTTLAAQAPRPLFLEVDDGGALVLNTKEFEHVKIYRQRNLSKLNEFIKACRTDSYFKEQFDTIVVDTVSEIQTLDRMRKIGDPLDEAWKFNEGIYARNNFYTNAICRAVLGLGKNTIFISHVREELVGEDRNQTIRVLPGLSSGPFKDLATNMDGIFFIKKEGKARQLQVTAGTTVLTKNRLEQVNIPANFLNPSFDQLLPYLEKVVKHD